jgi:hypothetical protein
LYEVAYLCGGPERVALTAVVTMGRDGRIKISPARHRVQVARDQASHPVERAVLDAAPWPGTRLRSVLDEAANSAAVRSAGDQLRRRALLGKHSHLTWAGHKLRGELEGEVPEDLRIAVMGPGDVDDELPGASRNPTCRSAAAWFLINGTTRNGTPTARHRPTARSLGTPGCPGAGEPASHRMRRMRARSRSFPGVNSRYAHESSGNFG